MTTEHKPHGAVPPAPPIIATPEQWQEARNNCAARVRERGQIELAASYEQGFQDAGWGMRHEMKRILG